MHNKITYIWDADMKQPVYNMKATKIESVSDEEATQGLIDAGPDPLNGLVASDILEKFCAARPVKNLDSIYDEGLQKYN